MKDEDKLELDAEDGEGGRTPQQQMGLDILLNNSSGSRYSRCEACSTWRNKSTWVKSKRKTAEIVEGYTTEHELCC